MNNDLTKPAGEGILELIRQNEGQLGWYEIAQSLGADEAAERAQVYLALRAFERLGAIRRDASEGVIRFWTVANNTESN
jgi:Fe2+ or Zn2+ uptake regulation protein